MVKEELFGKKTKCSYCKKEMLFYQVVEHEDACRKKHKICDGYNNCVNKGIIIMTNGKETSRWCKDCFNRFKKENPKIKFEVKT